MKETSPKSNNGTILDINESFKNFVSKENYEYIEKNGLYK